MKRSVLIIFFHTAQLLEEDDGSRESIAAVTSETEGMKPVHEGRGQFICNEGISAETSRCRSIQVKTCFDKEREKSLTGLRISFYALDARGKLWQLKSKIYNIIIIIMLIWYLKKKVGRGGRTSQ